MRGVNKAIVVGTLGQDPEVRYTASGTAVANFSLATSEKWTDKATGEIKEKTEWHRIKLFGKLAEIAGEYLKKGGRVYIEGKMTSDKYTDKQGVERYTHEVVGNEMQMLGDSGKGGAKADRAAATDAPAKTGPSKPATAPRQATIADDFDDDLLPF